MPSKSLADYTILAAAQTDAIGWYDRAVEELRLVCKLEGWDVETFTGILAATSPKVSVRRNVRITLEYMATGQLLDNVFASIRRSVEKFMDGGEIVAPKTGPFCKALRGDKSAVVLDSHMARLFGVDINKIGQKRFNVPCSQIVRDVATALDVANDDAQAMLWYGRRRECGEKPEDFPILEEYRNWLAHDRAFPTTGTIDILDGVRDEFALAV